MAGSSDEPVSRPTRRRRVTVVLEGSREMMVPLKTWALAESRTRHLERIAFRRSVSELLAHAYLQGITDTIDALEQRGMVL